MQTNQTRSMPTRFHLVLIKPTHYDDDGYPIQWIKAAIPSNTLACLNGLAEDACRRQVLGPDVAIRVHTYDETNWRQARPDRPHDLPSRWPGPRRIGRGAVEPIPTRRRLGEAVSACRSAGMHRRVSCLRLNRDAPRDAARDARGGGPWHFFLCRRGRAWPP